MGEGLERRLYRKGGRLKMIELLKALGLAFCLGCALVIGPLVLQLHVQHLEIEQHRMMQELEGENVRLPELRP